MTKDEYVNHLKIFEGYAPHMYLDTKGIVTIGIGIAERIRRGKLNSGNFSAPSSPTRFA